MKVEFDYSIDKDVENFINSTKSINSKTPTNFFELFYLDYSEVSEVNVKKFIKSYIQKNNINTQSKLEKVENRWRLIEYESIIRLEKIFKISYPIEQICAHGTFNERCTYNIQENYFFVNINNIKSNRTILHELFHFYTWHSIYQKLTNNGISYEKYNDIKESLTELLNIEFKDLLGDSIDIGYPQHQEMRIKIKELWTIEKDINKLIAKL